MTIQTTRAKARRERVQAMAREDILDAALRCFAQSGYAQTKVTDIASAAGYTAASLYTYFPGKKEIFVAAAERFVSGVEESMGPIPEHAHGDFAALGADIRERIRGLCAFGDESSDVLAFFMRLRWTGDAVIEDLHMKSDTCSAGTTSDEDERHGPHRLHHYATAVWRAMGVERFGIDPEVFASMVSGLIESFFARKYIFSAGGTLSDDADAITDLLLFGVRGTR